jgi:hypothetical protein
MELQLVHWQAQTQQVERAGTQRLMDQRVNINEKG